MLVEDSLPELVGVCAMRRRYAARPHMIAIAALRAGHGRIQRQCRRCLIAHNGAASIRTLRAWAYPGEPCKRWHRWSIVRALAKLGAKRIGWGLYAISR